ncbi:MAG: elongation factor P [Cytophagaceae bacterium]
MANTSDLSKGCFLRFNNELVVVLEYEHRTPGNLRAFYQVKMRNVRSGKLVEHRFRAGEDIELVRVEVKDYQYLYDDGNSLVVMDNDSYEQIPIPKELFGDSLLFMKEGMSVRISFDGETPVYAEPPTSVELEVTYTEPGIRGDTATKTLKPATLETGAEIRVPLFIEIGEKIKVDTRTGEYLERVK